MARDVFQFKDINKFLKKYVGEENIKLAELYQKGFPVADSFVLGKNAFFDFEKSGEEVFKYIEDEIVEAVRAIEEKYKISFLKGDFFLSLRCEDCFKDSMEIRSIGLSGINFDKFSNTFENKIDAYKEYIDYIVKYFTVTGKMDKKIFETIYSNLKKLYYGNINIDFYKKLKDEYIKTAKDYAGIELEDSALSQIMNIVKALYKKWFDYSEYRYRQENNIEDSSFYIIFSKALYENRNSISFKGEIESLEEEDGTFKGRYQNKNFSEMKREFPGIFNQIQTIVKKLKMYYRAIFKMEYIVEDGLVNFIDYSEKRSSETISDIYKMLKEGLITKQDLLNKINNEEFISYYKEKFKDEDDLLLKGEGIVKGLKTAYLATDRESSLNLLSKGREIILYLDDISKENSYLINKAGALIVNSKNLNKEKKEILRNFAKISIAVDTDYNKEKKILSKDKIVLKNEEKISIDSLSGYIFRGNKEKTFEVPQAYIREIASWTNAIDELEINPIYKGRDLELYQNDFLYSKAYCSLDSILSDRELKEYMFEITVEKNSENIKNFADKLEKRLTDIFERLDGKDLFLDTGRRSVYSFLPDKAEIEQKLEAEVKKHNIKTVNQLKKIIYNLEHADERFYTQSRGINQIGESLVYELVIRMIFSILKKRTDLKVKLYLSLSHVNSEKEFEDFCDIIQNIAYEESYPINRENTKMGLVLNSCGALYWKAYGKADFIVYDLLTLSESLCGLEKSFYNSQKQFYYKGMSFEEYSKDALIRFLNSSFKEESSIETYFILVKGIDLKDIDLNCKSIFTDTDNMIDLRLESLKKGEDNGL